MLIGRQAVQMDQLFAGLVAQGVGIWIGFQAFINMGVNMGALPTKGLTLPFMSYGRSSLIATLAWVGILLRVYHEAVQATRGRAAISLREGAERAAPRRVTGEVQEA